MYTENALLYNVHWTMYNAVSIGLWCTEQCTDPHSVHWTVVERCPDVGLAMQYNTTTLVLLCNTIQRRWSCYTIQYNNAGRTISPNSPFTDSACCLPNITCTKPSKVMILINDNPKCLGKKENICKWVANRGCSEVKTTGDWRGSNWSQ